MGSGLSFLQPVIADNQSASATLDFADGLYSRKMYGPAVAEYEKFIHANPNSQELSTARYRYADSFFFNKEYAEAIANFEIFLKQFPEDPRGPMAEFRLATARYFSGNTAQAIRGFRKLSLSAEDPVIQDGSQFYLAKCLEDRKESDGSLQILKQLIERKSQSEYASYAGIALGDAYAKRGAFDEALAGYRAAAGNDQSPAMARQARFKVAEILFSQKKYEEAAAEYDRVFSETPEKENTPEAMRQKESLKEKALLALFYCDYYRQDLENIERRFSSQMAAVETGPYRPEIEFLVASLLSDKGRHKEAIEKLNALSANEEMSPPLKEKVSAKKRFEEAELLAQDGHADKAMEAYRKVASDWPGSDMARLAELKAAWISLKINSPAQAREYFKRFANKYPASAEAEVALLQIIQIDLDNKDFKTAYQEAEMFIKTHDKSPLMDIGTYKVAVAAMGLRNFEAASKTFKTLLKNFESSKLYAESLYGVAVSLENERKIKESLLFYEKLLKRFPDADLSREVWGRLGYLYIRAHETEKAKAHFTTLILEKPDIFVDTDGVFWLIQTLLDEADYAPLDKILDALPARVPERDLKHEILFYKGESALGAGNFKKAVECYAQALQAKPEGMFAPQAYLGLGIGYAASDDAANAEKNLNEALKFDQEVKVTARARFELANLRLKAGHLEEAAKEFMRVAIFYDDAKYTPAALYKAGECFQSLNKTEEAKKAFGELQSHYPKSDWAKKMTLKEPSGG